MSPLHHDIVPGCRLIRLPVRGDERGSLVALESGREVPFEVRRVYYIYGTVEGVARGFHAHRSLQQLVIPVAGSCRMVLDDGRERVDVALDDPNEGLLIGDLVWREMHDFSADCVLLVLADRHYDPSDYIRDHAEFLAIAREARA